MKISVDGMLGSAKRINSQKQLDEDNLNKKKKDVKVDSVSIGTRINKRLDDIESEFKDIQSSLTRNQIIRNGIEQLQGNINKGEQDLQNILEEVQFDEKNVLKSFVGDNISEASLNDKFELNSNLINDDVQKLKKLQVELDNIMASDLAGQDRLENMMTNIDSIFSNSDIETLESISSLRADTVMRLVK